VPSLPVASGLFETHLTVSDLDRSLAFYRDVVGLPVALELPERGAAFLWIGGAGEAMLGLWSLGSAPLGLSLHIALRVSLDDVLGACAALRAAGLAPLSFFAEETTEPSVIAWMPAVAVYFRDPDGHLIEYLAMLDAQPRPELGIVAWSEWAGEAPLRIEPFPGPRAELRALFEEAEDSAAQLDGYLGAGDVLVAVEGERVVGHLQLVDGEIKNMAVDPAHRSRGIGLRLIEAAVERARAEGRTQLAVATAAADAGNLRFYQRAGFRLRSVERNAFTPATGYPTPTLIDGVELRDRVWLDRDL
jgi:ribosomal protein S18 acetylase RimI-like enzyme